MCRYFLYELCYCIAMETIYLRLYRDNYGLETMLCRELKCCCCFIYIYVIHLFSRKLTGRVYIYTFIPLFQEPVMFVYPGASS